MSYFTTEMAHHVISKMTSLESDLCEIYENHGLNFRQSPGRRNAIISQMQEVATAEALNAYGQIARVDGRTGYPDVCVDSLYRELECKLTSGSGGNWSLQADYSTLEKKGQIDFLYILADAEFDNFAVLFFEGLTKDDFHIPSPGSREKARMNKASAMEKCTVLMGDVSVKNVNMVNQYRDLIRNETRNAYKRIVEADERILNTTAPKKLMTLKSGRENTINRYLKKVESISDKMSYWKDSSLQFTIELEYWNEKM